MTLAEHVDQLEARHSARSELHRLLHRSNEEQTRERLLCAVLPVVIELHQDSSPAKVAYTAADYVERAMAEMDELAKRAKPPEPLLKRNPNIACGYDASVEKAGPDEGRTLQDCADRVQRLQDHAGQIRDIAAIPDPIPARVALANARTFRQQLTLECVRSTDEDTWAGGSVDGARSAGALISAFVDAILAEPKEGS